MPSTCQPPYAATSFCPSPCGHQRGVTDADTRGRHARKPLCGVLRPARGSCAPPAPRLFPENCRHARAAWRLISVSSSMAYCTASRRARPTVLLHLNFDHSHFRSPENLVKIILRPLKIHTIRWPILTHGARARGKHIMRFVSNSSMNAGFLRSVQVCRLKDLCEAHRHFPAEICWLIFHPKPPAHLSAAGCR